MKLAWLVWNCQEDKDAGYKPELWFYEPDPWKASIQIVYAEILK